MKPHTLLGLLGLSLLLTLPRGAPAENAAADTALAPAPVLIQPGSTQLLLGVTTDNFAIYQEAQTLYATALVPGARRHEIAQVPNNNFAEILQVGKVAMLWIDPQRNLPGSGVSPLVIWSAAGGAKRIAERSAVGFVATDASPENLRVLFTTNVLPDGGSRGDLALIDVFAATRAQILVRDITLGFPFAQCRPVAAFIGPPGRAVPTAEYCRGTDTTATLSRWVLGQRIDLIDNIATPLPFTLETNPQENEFFVRLAGNGNPVVVTDRAEVRVIDTVPSTQGFITDRGTTVYATQSSPSASSELRLARRGSGPIAVATPFAFAFANSHNFSGYSKRPTPSPDGRLALFAGAQDPATRLTDMQLLDLRSGQVIVIDSRLASFGAFDVFTEDSRYALYFSDFNLTVGLSALYAADRAGVAQRISDDDSVFFNAAATGSLVSYNDRPQLNSAPLGSFALTRADLRIVDAARPQRGSRLIAAQANLVYFPSHGRRGLVFTTDSAERPGLYLAGASR